MNLTPHTLLAQKNEPSLNDVKSLLINSTGSKSHLLIKIEESESLLAVGSVSQVSGSGRHNSGAGSHVDDKGF
jgi:hypothetical protein